jgi:hypothetical protein
MFNFKKLEEFQLDILKKVEDQKRMIEIVGKASEDIQQSAKRMSEIIDDLIVKRKGYENTMELVTKPARDFFSAMEEGSNQLKALVDDIKKARDIIG